MATIFSQFYFCRATSAPYVTFESATPYTGLYESSYYASSTVPASCRSGGQPAPPSGLYGHYPEHGYYGDSDVISRKRKSTGSHNGSQREAEKRSMMGYNYTLVSGYERAWAGIEIEYKLKRKKTNMSNNTIKVLSEAGSLRNRSFWRKKAWIGVTIHN